MTYRDRTLLINHISGIQHRHKRRTSQVTPQKKIALSLTILCRSDIFTIIIILLKRLWRDTLAMHILDTNLHTAYGKERTDGQ